MGELTNVKNNLPDNINDLSKFVLVGREKLVSVRAEIRAIEKAKLANEVREQKLAEAQQIAEMVTLAEVQVGKLLSDIPKADNGGVNQYTDRSLLLTAEAKAPTKAQQIEELGFSRQQAERMQTMAKHEDIVQKAIEEARNNDDIVSRSLVLNMIRQEKKEQEFEKAKQDIAEQYKAQENKPILYVMDSIANSPVENYDLLITDPPYSTDVEDIKAFAESWLPKALAGVKSTGFAYVFIGAYPEEVKAYLNCQIPDNVKLEQLLVWTYKNTLGNNPKDRYKLNYQMCLFYRGIDAPALDCPLTNEQWAVQEINAPDGRLGNRYHAWQKPMEIAERFIRHSTKQGDIVYDPFACTGTFILAAAKLGRKAYGAEINKENANIAFERGCLCDGLV